MIYRGEDGVSQVLSAYCPHLGADLAVGEVIGDRLRCAFHHWQYDREGYCVETGVGDPPPPTACLFKFPTVERWGLIFAFNGHGRGKSPDGFQSRVFHGPEIHQTQGHG